MFLIGAKDPIWRGDLFSALLGGGGTPAPQPVQPSNISPPAITGTPRVNDELTGSRGVWIGTAPITYARRWQESANGTTGWTDISGALAETYAPDVARQGRFIRTGVRASNSVGSSSWIWSASVGPVAAAVAAWDVQGGDQQVLILAMPSVPVFIVTGGDQSLIIEAAA